MLSVTSRIRRQSPGQSASAASRLRKNRGLTPISQPKPLILRERSCEMGCLTSVFPQPARSRLESLLDSWREILPTEPVRELACVQLERLPIRAADALYLGAALIWCNQKPRGRLFVCNDRRLGDAARQAGFTVETV